MKTPRSARPNKARPPSTSRVFLKGVDPIQLFELLENHYADTGEADGSPYRRLYAESLAAFLERDHEAAPFAKLLAEVDAAVGVETAMKHAGFILGFDCCRQLLLGELDLEALNRADGAE